MTLEVQGLRVERNGAVLQNGITFSVTAGNSLGITGPNGCGKSTLLAQIVGAEPIHQGQISVPEVRVPCVLIEQIWSTPYAFTVHDVLLWSNTDASRIFTTSKKLDITHLLDRDVRILSGGERGRVSLARALISSAPVVLLDEPTAHLSREYAGLAMVVLKHLAAQNRSIVVVTHDDDLLAECDDVLIL